MRENLARYEWARQYLANLLEGDGEEQPYRWGGHRFSVRRWCERDDQFFWQLMPTTTVTKMYPADRYGISPRHGTAVRQGRAFYHPWNYDPYNHPYKVQDPVDGTWYPSNDFGRGDMTSGDCPDDGRGMVINGERFFPVREYAIGTYLDCVVPLMERMSQAYLLGGDAAIAHKCAVLLASVAHEYPNNTDKADRCQKKPWGRNSGIVTDYIWETFKLTSMALTYDALYDAIGEDEELVAFLRARGVPVQTPRDVRRYIEERIFRTGMLALQQHVIHGNEGHHQETAMTLALVMDDHGSGTHPNSQEIVDWCMYGEGAMASVMSNCLFRDGAGFESPGYNTIRLDFISAAEKFEQLRKLHPDLYPHSAYPDIFAHPKARALFDHFIDYVVLQRFGPSIGDHGGGTLVPRHYDQFWQYALSPAKYLFAYRKYGDPRYARVYLGNRDTLPPGRPFEKYDGEAVLAAAQTPAAQLAERTRALDDYGMAVLHSGQGPRARALVLNYSNHFQHCQFDRLNLGLYYQYTDHLPDLGYPFTWEYRQWDSELFTHNTVVVDECPGKYVCPLGRCHLLAEEGPLHVVTAAHDPYMHDVKYNPGVPPVTLYERTGVLVDVSPEDYYVVDLFAVAGGEQHDQSWHGGLCPMERPPLVWQAQPRGTVAGLEVAQFAKYRDRFGREQSGPLSFLTNVNRTSAEAPARFTWKMGLDYDARLRLTIVPLDGPVELILSSGRSPARPPDFALQYLFVRRTGAPGLQSRFLTVIDTRPGPEPTVREVEVLEREPLTLRITHTQGVDQVVLNVPMPTGGPFAPRELGLSLTRGGRTWQVGRVPGQIAPGYQRGTITACDYERNVVTVEGLREDGLAGRFVRLYTDHRSSLYRILQAEGVGATRAKLSLDQTPFLFEVQITDSQAGKVINSLPINAFTEKEDEDGRLRPWRNWNRDAVLVSEDGKHMRRIEGLAGGTSIHLAGAPPADQLREEFADANGDGRIMARVYDYGVGAGVEVAQTSARQQ